MNEIKAQKRWRLFGGITVAVLFIVALVVHIAGKVEFDAVALTLFVCVVGSIAFALSQQLGIAKIAAGPLEVEIKPLVERAVAELPPEQAGEVWQVLKKHSGLFPVIGVRLLWIDDRPEKLIPQRRLLRRLGIEIVMVRSTKAAKAELMQDGDFALIIQDRLRDRSGDARTLVEWLNTEGADYGVGKVPLVVFSWNPFDASIGVKEWNWITQDFASLLNRIADEVQKWKKHLPIAPNKPPDLPRFEETTEREEELVQE